MSLAAHAFAQACTAASASLADLSLTIGLAGAALLGAGGVGLTAGVAGATGVAAGAGLVNGTGGVTTGSGVLEAGLVFELAGAATIAAV